MAARCHWKNVMRLANDVRGGVRSGVWKYRQGSFAVSQFRFAVFAPIKRSCQRCDTTLMCRGWKEGRRGTPDAVMFVIVLNRSRYRWPNRSSPAALGGSRAIFLRDYVNPLPQVRRVRVLAVRKKRTSRDERSIRPDLSLAFRALREGCKFPQSRLDCSRHDVIANSANGEI